MVAFQKCGRLYAVLAQWIQKRMLRVHYPSAEDKMLNALVEKHGSRWTLIGQDMPHRTKKQCFERYRYGGRDPPRNYVRMRKKLFFLHTRAGLERMLFHTRL